MGQWWRSKVVRAPPAQWQRRSARPRQPPGRRGGSSSRLLRAQRELPPPRSANGEEWRQDVEGGASLGYATLPQSEVALPTVSQPPSVSKPLAMSASEPEPLQSAQPPPADGPENVAPRHSMLPPNADAAQGTGPASDESARSLTPLSLVVHRQTPVHLQSDPALLTSYWPRSARASAPMRSSDNRETARIARGPATARLPKVWGSVDRGRLTSSAEVNESGSDFADADSTSQLWQSRSSIASRRLKTEIGAVKQMASAGQIIEAIERLDDLIKKVRTFVERERDHRHQSEQQIGRAGDALAQLLEYRALLQLQPLRQGDAKGAARAPSEALLAAEEALTYRPYSSSAHFRRGFAQQQLQRPTQAAYSFAHGLQSSPSNGAIAVELVRAVSAVGHDRFFHQRARTPQPTYPAPERGGSTSEAPRGAPTESILPPATYPPEKPATPPKEKQRLELDDSWRQLDIADIMEEQARMKHTIDEALLDGRIDAEEVESISWQLKRSGLSKAKKEEVLAAIVQNYEEAVDLGPEHVALLRSITPPDPLEDWQGILKVLDEEVGFLKTIFRFYCLEGKTGGQDVETMGMAQFGKFCKACTIVDKNLPISACDRIFLRANQDRLGDLDDVMSKKLTKKQAAKKKKMKKAGPDHELEVHEFAAATIRCAHAKYRQLPSVADRYRKLMTDCIKANSVFDLEDDLSVAVNSVPVVEVMQKHEKGLVRIFNKWCAADATAFTAAEASTMNLPEWMMFLGACNLVGPGGISSRIARSMFVQVNLDDELYEQSDSDNDASELVFDEFSECVVRLGDAMWGNGATYGDTRQAVIKGDLDHADCLREYHEGLAKMLDWFIAEELIPRATKTGKYR